MSKVKIRNEHLARKAVRENRRYETTRKKEERLKKAQNNEYPFLIGYYVIDTRVSYQKKKVVVPEHTETRWVLVEKEIPIHDKSGNTITKKVPDLVKKTVVVPQHVTSYRSGYTEEKIEPRAKRINAHKKRYRKEAARKFRRASKHKEFVNGSNYKRDYDIEWEIW